MIGRWVVTLWLIVGCLPVFAEQPSPTSVLPPELPWQGKSLELALPADHDWATPFERSGLARTPRYAETVAWLDRLVAAAPELQIVSLGRSAEGRDIWMVVASLEGAADPKTLRRNGRPTLLAHAGIHSGEIDGKDAGLMLLRDMTVRGTRSELLKTANLLFVPILSVDGHERFSRHNRMNQRGPVEMGWRTNRRNLNLNRDYAKLETEELQALVPAIHRWRPDLYLDLHVTDGADYQYDITYGFHGPHGWSPDGLRWLAETFTPLVNAGLERMGHVPGPLVFAANQRDLAGGILDWTAGPRYSNAWGDARHLPTVLVENHSLKPYLQRVLGTYVLMDHAMQVLGSHAASLREAVRADRERRSAEVVLDWRINDTETPPQISFKGVRSELYHSSVTGNLNVRWTGQAVEQEVPVIRKNLPTVTVKRPAFYYVPAAWYPIAEKLRMHGVELEWLGTATTLEVESYRLPDAELDAANSPFEGRALYTAGDPVVERRTITLPPGSHRVDASQPLGTLAVLLLEPQAPDSFFRWGYFAEILQRTEYFESYVMEPMAQEMLEADPDLRREFEARLLADAEFAGSPRSRLNWFYEKTPFHDAEFRLYPIHRSVD